MVADYDFGAGVRGEYAARYAERTTIVHREVDVNAASPSSRSADEESPTTPGGD